MTQGGLFLCVGGWGKGSVVEPDSPSTLVAKMWWKVMIGMKRKMMEKFKRRMV